MKKSILTIALAAMMLVAFTACEQQVPNVLPDDVNYITIVQTEDAVEGKAFDPSLFNVMVYSSNPNVAPVTVSGKGYVSLSDTSATTFAAGQKVNATYAGKTASPLAVSVAEVLDVKVEGFPESVVQNAAMLKTSTLTASVTLSNGTELELGADDYTIWYDVSAAVTGEDEEGTPVTAKVFFDIENTGTPVLSKTVANLKVTKDTSNDPKAIEKKEVDELSVKWTITGVDGKTRTENTNSITVYAGESVTYTLYGGIADDDTNRPLYEMKSGDYALSLDTLSNVIGKAFGANDITGKTIGTAPNTTTVQPYTATVNFVSDSPEDSNYEAGSVAPITLSVTVKDNIVSVPSGSWIWDSNGDGKADEIQAATAFSITTPAYITKTVKSVGGEDVKLVAATIKDRSSWTDKEVVAGSEIKVTFLWEVNSTDKGSYPSTIKGEDTVTIKVAAATQPQPDTGA